MKATQPLIILAFLLSAVPAMAQKCAAVSSSCETCYSEDYISDGQEYQAFVNGEEEAEFTATFFGGNTYRVAACTNDDQALLFQMLDQEGNVLFDNAEFSNTRSWDFVIANTMDCTVVAQLDPDKSTTGCAVILIGFKQ